MDGALHSGLLSSSGCLLLAMLDRKRDSLHCKSRQNKATLWFKYVGRYKYSQITDLRWLVSQQRPVEYSSLIPFNLKKK